MNLSIFIHSFPRFYWFFYLSAFILEIDKKSYIQTLDLQGFEIHSELKRKVVKFYESTKRCAADSGSTAVRGYEVGA
jgi:hypothetical protein